MAAQPPTAALAAAGWTASEAAIFMSCGNQAKRGRKTPILHPITTLTLAIVSE
jgi:hypothetical protein